MRTPLTSFNCQRCGSCCRVPGYVALESGEAETIASFLGLDIYAFTAQYAAITVNRNNLSLIERPDGGCIFIQDDNTCRIQPVKPAQCKGFPFQWKSKQLKAICPELRVGATAGATYRSPVLARSVESP
jgi:Fe-S-cluster containining protein